MSKTYIKKIISILATLIIIFNLYKDSELYSQEKLHPQLIDGINQFWNANFQEAVAILKKSIAQDKLSNEEKFSAYLYLGFSMLRSTGDVQATENFFQHAVKTNPALRPDSRKIPPDLMQQFAAVREKMIGSLYIATEPDSADIIVQCIETGDEFKAQSPFLFKELLTSQYSITLSKEHFLTNFETIQLTPMKTDSLLVPLTPLPKPRLNKRWVWITGGSAIIASTAYLLLQAPDHKQQTTTDLPVPPNRPK
jgi:hypothetical protein